MGVCPFLSIAAPNQAWQQCMGPDCQLWDEGVYDEYEEGCGLVSREDRRV